MIRSLIARGAAALALLSFAFAPASAVNISVKDGVGSSQTICAATQSDSSLGYCFVYHNAAGAQEDLATKAQQALIAAANGNPYDPYSVATDSTPASQVALLKGLIKTLGPAPAQVGGKIDTVIPGIAANRSAVIGFAGTANAATSTSTSLVVNTTSNFTNQAGVLTGIPFAGQIVSGTGIPAATTVSAVTANSATQYTLTLSAAATVASGAAVTSGGPQQIMAANLSRRGMAQQNQSSAPCYINGVGSATSGPDSLLIAAGAYNPSLDSHVGTGAIAAQCNSPASPLYGREW